MKYVENVKSIPAHGGEDNLSGPPLGYSGPQQGAPRIAFSLARIVLDALYTMPMPIQQHAGWALKDSSLGHKCADVARKAIKEESLILTFEDEEYIWLKQQVDVVIPKMWGINADTVCELFKEEKLPVIEKRLGLAPDEPAAAPAVADASSDDAGA